MHRIMDDARRMTVDPRAAAVLSVWFWWAGSAAQ